MDLFFINQSLKNESGKDVDLIEAYLQDSLKAMYVTVFEYLNNVPQDIPEFVNKAHGDEAKDHEKLGDQMVENQLNGMISPRLDDSAFDRSYEESFYSDYSGQE